MARFIFTRALLAPDEHHPTLTALARRIQALRMARPRRERGLVLRPERLGERGARPAAEACAVHAADIDGNAETLLGYVLISGETGREIEQALRRALADIAPPALAADPEAGRDAA